MVPLIAVIGSLQKHNGEKRIEKMATVGAQVGAPEEELCPGMPFMSLEQKLSKRNNSTRLVTLPRLVGCVLLMFC
jgi:hypothetical protein